MYQRLELFSIQQNILVFPQIEMQQSAAPKVELFALESNKQESFMIVNAL